MRIEYAVLEEKLVKATKVEIARLSQKMARDPELNRMLATPMRNIPQYRYLYNDPVFDQHSLLDALRLFDFERRPNFYFSKIGNEFTGFIVYEDNGKVINRIKMASTKEPLAIVLQIGEVYFLGGGAFLLVKNAPNFFKKPPVCNRRIVIPGTRPYSNFLLKLNRDGMILIAFEYIRAFPRRLIRNGKFSQIFTVSGSQMSACGIYCVPQNPLIAGMNLNNHSVAILLSANGCYLVKRLFFSGRKHKFLLAGAWSSSYQHLRLPIGEDRSKMF